MDAKARRTRTLLILAALVAPLGLPLAAAQVPSPAPVAADQGKSVGTFDVTPVSPAEGLAQGAIVSSLLAESGAGASGEGILKQFAVAAPDAGGHAQEVFSAIDIAGFQPVSKLEGVGTSALSLRSAGLVMSLTDNANSLLQLKSIGSADQIVTLHTPDDVFLAPAADAAGSVWTLTGSGQHAFQGALVLLQADNQQKAEQASSLVLQGQHEAQATLKQGAQLVFRADTRYMNTWGNAVDQKVQAYNKAVVAAMASGKLVGEATTEFSQGAQLIASAQYHAFAQARTEAREAHRVTTTLKTAANAAGEACAAADGAGSAAGAVPGASGSGAGSAQAQACARFEVLAYDLDYVDIPAQTADQVAVYIDGALAQKVSAASDVATHADSYWAWAVDGRVLVVTNVAAKVNAATQVTIAALAQGEAAASTLAELDAASAITAQISGGFSLLGDLEGSASGSGQVIGSFSSFFANEAKGSTSVSHYTDVRSSEEIFTKIEVAADIAADAAAEFTAKAQASAAAHAQESTSAAANAAVTMTTHVGGNLVATTEFTDSVYSSIETTAELQTIEEFHLSNDVRAHALADAMNVVELDGPAGKVGYLILTKADGTASANNGFDLSKSQDVKATIQGGEKVVFRGAAEAQARASADLVAKAIANGALASESSVGYVANAIATARVDYQKDVHGSIRVAKEATHRGLVTLDAVNDAAIKARATAFAFVADQATLAANSADDVLVTVDGKAATSVDTAAELLVNAHASASGEAKYWVGTSQGLTQVVVLLPELAASHAYEIVASSKLDQASREASALDVFGQFEPGYGGLESGKIVSLVAKPDAGLVLDYTLAAKATANAAAGTTTKVFDAVRLGGSALQAGGASGPASIKWDGPEGSLEAFDVSGAVLKATAAADTRVAFDLASNIEAKQVDERVIMLSAPDFSGAIIAIGEGALATSGDAGGQVDAQLHAGATVLFKAFSGFESELSEAQKEAQANAIANGKLLGQVILTTSHHATHSAAVNYYADVLAVTQVATSDKVQVVVDSATHEGKSIILSLDRNTVKGLIEGDAKLIVDGHELKQAASYEDALKPDADKYYLITSGAEAGLQAIVTLSHFSTRTITLESPSPPSIFLWTTIFLGVVVVGQAVYPRWKRRNA